MSHAQTGVKALSTLRPLQSMAASLCLSALLLGCAEPPLDCDINPNIVDLTTDTSPIHDPAMIKAEDVYYLYSSSNFGAFYSSKDMRKWQLEGAVFNEIPPWLVEKFRWQTTLARQILPITTAGTCCSINRTTPTHATLPQD